MQPGPPFKVADIVLCTPWNGHRQVALVTEASPPRYKVLLENGTRMDTAVDRVDIHPDWNHDHPEFAPRNPEPFVEERRLLLRQLKKRGSEETVDIHRRAKRRRVAFTDPPHQQQHHPFRLPPTETAQSAESAVTLPPIDDWQDRAPPPEPPPTHWPVELELLLTLCEKGWVDKIGNTTMKMVSSGNTAATTPMDDETLTTMSWAGSESEWSDESDDENDDQGKPTSLMQPQHLAEVHPFIQTLHEWKEGIEVDCGDDWEWSTIEEAVLRGPHPTACTEES